MPKDNCGNVIMNSSVLKYDCNNNVVMLPKGKLAVMEGVDDLLVIDSGDVLMICRKGSEGDVRRFLNDAKMKIGDKFA
jgi:mannose-1-phosphate guanylyltransferase